MNNEKMCPLLLAGNVPADRRCQGPACAWWASYTERSTYWPGGRCALVAMAQALGDLADK